MPDRKNREAHYENHSHANELRNLAAHAHESAAVHHGKEDHLTDHELTQRAHEHEHADGIFQHPTGKTAEPPTHDEIAALAHKLWQERGAPEGSGDEDWFRAVEQLSAGND